MKKFTTVAASMAACVCAFGQLTGVRLTDETEPNYSDADLLRTWGWLLADRFNLESFDFNADEIAQIVEGMEAQIKNRGAPTDLDRSIAVMQQYFVDREERILARRMAENKAKERQFFDQLFGLPDVQALGSGLYYQVLSPGSGPKPRPTDTVIVNYEGRFINNEIFDSTVGRDPVAFKLNEVIPGWEQGLRLIGEGDKVKLYVPSKLAYGDEGRPGIPPASTLVFEVELLKIGLPDAPGAPDAPAGGAEPPVPDAPMAPSVVE